MLTANTVVATLIITHKCSRLKAVDQRVKTDRKHITQPRPFQNKAPVHASSPTSSKGAEDEAFPFQFMIYAKFVFA